jgi:hypothetical protein
MWVGAEEAVSKLNDSLALGILRSEGPADNRPDLTVGSIIYRSFGPEMQR